MLATGAEMRVDDEAEIEEAALQDAVGRVLGGDLREVGRAIEALPEGHPRRRILLANYRQAMALLTDLPRLLAR